jgi:threonine aldolase
VKVIDLRSDTVTKPTDAMRQAMAQAEVGDDVYDEDPSVNRLQERAAELMGKQAGLFVPTGTMGNSIALKVHTQPGDEVLMDAEAHSMLYEAGLPATIAHVLTRQFHSRQGVPNVSEIAHWIQDESLHSPRTSLLVLENTHNRAGGAIVPLGVHRELWALAQERKVRVHLDGARLFNAAVASGVSAADYAACADSVTFCLSKGLGCPVGSVLCGSAEFIEKARRVRKMLGGGMRQAGVLAAAGLYALEHHIRRLAEDHANATRLAQGIADISGIMPDTPTPPTNMVYITTQEPAETVVARLKERGVLCNATAANRIRFVAHLDVSAADIDYACRVLRD